MRKLLLVSAILSLSVPAFGQQQNPPADPNGNNPAINSSSSTPASPAAGANSFTEGQAKSRIEGKGYTNISGLKKDANGVWRGKATKGGKQVDVSVDFKGDVVAR